LQSFHSSLLEIHSNFQYPSRKKIGGFLLSDAVIFPAEFVEKYKHGLTANEIVIDVRELWEWEYYHLENAIHIPMNQLPQVISEIPLDSDLYIICAHGVRSAYVTDYLLQQNYTKVWNVAGGMAAVSSFFGFEYD
jgi:rhodanese-related sulfurtransferase